MTKDEVEALGLVRKALVGYEVAYPEDGGPRMALEVAERCLREDSEDNRRECLKHTWASYYAAERACYYLALYAAKRKRHFLDISIKASEQAKDSHYDSQRI